jgi:hypothetical protein
MVERALNGENHELHDNKLWKSLEDIKEFANLSQKLLDVVEALECCVY